MWQFFELGALVTSATQDVVDKFAIVRSESIDTFVASFHRTALFLSATVVIGLLLRNVEVMTIGAVFYLAPLLYLFIDTHLLGMHFSAKEITGIALLVGGGVAFSIDGNTFRPKPELTRAVWGALVLAVFYNGAEAYLFKYLHATYDLNGVSFYASLWLLSTACLFVLVLSQKKERLLVDRTARTYLPRVAVSKSCDAVSSVLNGPSIVSGCCFANHSIRCAISADQLRAGDHRPRLFQNVIERRTSSASVAWKAFAVALLVAGSFLVA
jgi:positive regulator of sigma E activity